MLTAEFISQFQKALTVHKQMFCQESGDFINKARGNYREVTLARIGYDNTKDSISDLTAKLTIDNTLSNPENFTFTGFSTPDGSFEHNEIKVRVEIYRPSSQPLQVHSNLLEFNRQQIIRSEEQFWEKEPNTQFRELSNFKSFAEVTVPSTAIGRTHGYAVLNYNNDGWREYFFSLFNYFFSEYKFSETNSNKSKNRFLKETEKFYMGLEYKFENAERASHINVPAITIIYAPKGTSTKTNLRSIKFTSLGIFGNPFFFPPTGYLRNYAGLRQVVSIGGEYKYTNQMITNSDESVTIIGPEDFGEIVKKHAFFYLHLLKETSESYLNYIEKCLNDSI